MDNVGAYPMYRLELGIYARDAGIKERVRACMVELLSSEQQASGPSSGNCKTQPKFDWKDHQ